MKLLSAAKNPVYTKVVAGSSDIMTVHGATITSGFATNSNTLATYEAHSYSATAANAGTYYGTKARGTIGSPTIVANNDFVLINAAVAYDGTDYEACGYTAFMIDGTPGANDMPGKYVIAVTPSGSFTPVVAVTVSQDKSVAFAGALSGITTVAASGIVTLTGTAATQRQGLLLTGTTTAYQTLAITNTTGSTVVGTESSAAGTLSASTLAYSTVIGSMANTALHLMSNSLVRATIFSNGNMAIGTTTDNSAKLQVSGIFSASQVFVIGDGTGLASTVALSNVTTSTISTGVVSFFTSGTTARSNTGWWKIYDGTTAKYVPFLTTITG